MFFKKKTKAIVTHPVIRKDEEWTLVSDKLPTENGRYLTTINGRVEITKFAAPDKWSRADVVAWKTLSEPYKE